MVVSAVLGSNVDADQFPGSIDGLLATKKSPRASEDVRGLFQFKQASALRPKPVFHRFDPHRHQVRDGMTTTLQSLPSASRISTLPVSFPFEGV